MLEIVSSEKLEQWISGSYSCACNHGFHDMELSRKHFLMLVMTEVSEAVEADRKGLHADLYKFDRIMKYADGGDKSFCDVFMNFVKDSVEDELADVCIRLFDYCGAFGIELSDVHFDEELRSSWDELFGEHSLCENCYELCSLVCDIDDGDEGDDDDGIGCVLGFIFCMCYHMGIDLERHIELKMRYNKLRPTLHGKKY